VISCCSWASMELRRVAVGPAAKQDEKCVRFGQMLGCSQPEGSWKPRVSIHTAKTGAGFSRQRACLVPCHDRLNFIWTPSFLQQSRRYLSSPARGGKRTRCQGLWASLRAPQRRRERNRPFEYLLPWTIARPQLNYSAGWLIGDHCRPTPSAGNESHEQTIVCLNVISAMVSSPFRVVAPKLTVRDRSFHRLAGPYGARSVSHGHLPNQV
jgi:hypothetical protein